jgi:probable phosphoglycerate mutase
VQLFLIRHALPERVATDDGSPADPPLSEHGHAQAARMAGWLASDGVDRVYTSPLRRAHQTALPLAEALGLEVELEPRVSEYDRDSDLYVPLEELKETDYPAWKAFMDQGYPPGIDLERFCSDVIDAMESIIAANRGRNVAVVCHGGVINVWAAHVLGMPHRLFCDVRYTSISRFLATSSGLRSVSSLNEAAHLRDL